MSYNALVVDDSRTIRSIIAKALKLSGVDFGNIREASNGREALRALDEEWVDIVFADINMPVMDGIQMIDEMKKNGIMGNVPVVVVSTERSVSRMRELETKGISAYLWKPFTPEKIKEVVARLLHEGRKQDT